MLSVIVVYSLVLFIRAVCATGSSGERDGKRKKSNLSLCRSCLVNCRLAEYNLKSKANNNNNNLCSNCGANTSETNTKGNSNRRLGINSGKDGEELGGGGDDDNDDCRQVVGESDEITGRLEVSGQQTRTGEANLRQETENQTVIDVEDADEKVLTTLEEEGEEKEATEKARFRWLETSRKVWRANKIINLLRSPLDLLQQPQTQPSPPTHKNGDHRDDDDEPEFLSSRKLRVAEIQM